MEVICHRGAAAYHPGNSLASFEAALAMGCDRIECDLHVTADRVLVLAHDSSVRLDDGNEQPIRALPASTVCSPATGIITFDELAARVGSVPLMIDIKQRGYETETIAAIQEHQLHRTSSVSSTHASTLHQIRAAFPTMRAGLSTGHWVSTVAFRGGHEVTKGLLRLTVPLPLIVALRLTGATEVNLQFEVATRPLVRMLHMGGWRINLWTVNHRTAIERAIDIGVDGIISNRPDLVAKIVGSTIHAEASAELPVI
ncbi:MAG: glycerophosphodiester phosphodiesterase [Chloroflexota bacterium]|nr:glycerophosphodiester phosphodiesterase [Chloroflexota bacterium]